MRALWNWDASTHQEIDRPIFLLHDKIMKYLNCNKHMYVEVIKIINNLNFQELACWWYKRKDIYILEKKYASYKSLLTHFVLFLLFSQVGAWHMFCPLFWKCISLHMDSLSICTHIIKNVHKRWKTGKSLIGEFIK